MSTSPAASQPGMMDPPIDSFIDFSEYDNNNAYQSPALSPAAGKAPYTRPTPVTTSTPATLLSTNQPMSGPSHQYDLYKQQTGIVPGALANTLAVNQSNAQITGYSSFNIDTYLGLDNSNDAFDFNTSPSQNTMGASDIDMDFDSPAAEPSFFFPETTINPNAIGGQEATTPVLPTQAGNVGRLWPGMHQQAALAKAQAQQRQQQQIIQQQQQQRQTQVRQQRQKSAQPTDPIVEQKITQLLNSMRAKSTSSEPGSNGNGPLLHLPRPKKDEDDMDEDERLLASEEGKKLSSKERRQLRNKVSARAFRSRRKEYITQLEAEIANKVTENGDLRAQNRALIEENKRLSDLTRMLLSSPSFSDFLDRLSANPSMVPQSQPQQQQQQQQPQLEQQRPQEQQRQVPKDVNPYAAQQQIQQQQIGVAMIPEHHLDFSALSMDGLPSAEPYTFTPQVYNAVLDTPDTIDASVLSGKSSNFVGRFDSEDEKVEMPVIERPAPVEAEKPIAPEIAVVVDEAFENDPDFALYHDSPAPSSVEMEAEEPVELDVDGFSHVDIFGGIEPEKVLARYELVDASEEEAAAVIAMARVQRISASLEAVCARLESLTVDL
ncbi:BZIP transcription factor [Pleurostoma richardsiae]|uniref:BZIP transcription factor n=1 Tax=Pleurostoma richardsiae TaxID=41990 RepID=A0AA38RP66_9PEZI|nr:BZIP transcription factor [Pleurostoma richardsiae]